MSHPDSVLVTGASGFLGYHLTHKLIAQGVTPRVLVRAESRVDKLPRSHIEVCQGDLRDAEAVTRAVVGIDIVYHCAAMVKSSGRKEDFFDCNVRGTEQLLAAAKNAGVKKVIHVSSVAVYGPSKTTIVREHDGYDPFPQQRGYYTWSKIEADRAALQFGKAQAFPVIVMRPGIIYGPGAKPSFARLHYNLKGKAHLIIGSPDALLPLVFVGSVVEALLLAGERTDGEVQAYNIVDGAIRQEDYIQRHMEAMGKKLRAVYLPPRLVYPVAGLLEALYGILKKGSPALSRYRLLRACQSLAHDTTKARKDLGWRPVVSLPEGLAQTWQWWRQAHHV